MKEWLSLHGRLRMENTDFWYVEFANKLWLLLEKSPFHNLLSHAEWTRALLFIALYFEDCIADSGNWRQFMRWHKRHYGRYVPFYSLKDDYVPDEVNFEDVAFLLWTFLSSNKECTTHVSNPYDVELMSCAAFIYALIYDAFEEAPISASIAEEWLVDSNWLEKEKAHVPSASLGDDLPANVERFLQASHGEALMFFEKYGSLRQFFVNSLRWEDKDEALLPELEEADNFVLYANSKGLLIAPNVAQYICTLRNQFYNPEKASANSFRLFTEPGLCPFDLLKYGMEQNLLPDAQFPFDKGKELLHNNWDFVARWFLGDYYEGD